MQRQQGILILEGMLCYLAVFLLVEANPYLRGFTIIQQAALLAMVTSALLLYLHTDELEYKERARVLVVFAALGVLISGVMTYAHYNSASEFCPGGQGGEVPCDLVNKSVFSEILGIPIALLGMLGYAFMGYLAYEESKWPPKKVRPMILHLLALAALAFTVWLNHVQINVLNTLCLFCEFSAMTVVALVMISYQQWRDTDTE